MSKMRSNETGEFLDVNIYEIGMDGIDTGRLCFYALEINDRFAGVIEYNFYTGNWGNSDTSISGSPIFHDDVDELIACTAYYESVDEFKKEISSRFNDE